MYSVVSTKSPGYKAGRITDYLRVQSAHMHTHTQVLSGGHIHLSTLNNIVYYIYMALVSSPDLIWHCLMYNAFFPVCNTKTESMLELVWGLESRLENAQPLCVVLKVPSGKTRHLQTKLKTRPIGKTNIIIVFYFKFSA